MLGMLGLRTVLGNFIRLQSAFSEVEIEKSVFFLLSSTKERNTNTLLHFYRHRILSLLISSFLSRCFSAWIFANKMGHVAFTCCEFLAPYLERTHHRQGPVRGFQFFSSATQIDRQTSRNVAIDSNSPWAICSEY